MDQPARFLPFCLALLLLSAPGGGQELDALRHTTPEQRADLQTEMMESQLGLSGEPLEQVRAVNLKYAQEMDPVLKGSGSKFERLRKAREIEAAKDAAMKQVLMRKRLEDELAKKQGGG
jgi:hypothetical protein